VGFKLFAGRQQTRIWEMRCWLPKEGVQPIVQQSAVCPLGSRASRSQTWLREIDARSCVELVDNWIFRRNFLRLFCEAIPGFAKLLSPEGKLWIFALLVRALQIATMLLISNWKISISMELFCPSSSRAFAKPETWLRKTMQQVASIYPLIEPINATFFCKAHKPGASRSALVWKGEMWTVLLLLEGLQLMGCHVPR